MTTTQVTCPRCKEKGVPVEVAITHDSEGHGFGLTRSTTEIDVLAIQDCEECGATAFTKDESDAMADEAVKDCDTSDDASEDE